MRHIDGLGQTGKRFSKAGTQLVQMPVLADFPACSDLDRYWDGLRDGKLVASRMEFDPRGVERSLSNTFVAERVAKNVVRIRVSGSALNALLGMDVRGMPITAFFDPESRDKISDALAQVFDSPCKAIIDLHSPAGMGRRVLRARLILLPMCDVHGEINRLVGCLEPVGSDAATPRRFVVDQVHTEALTSDAETRDTPRVARLHRPALAPKRPVRQPAPSRDFAFADRDQAKFQSSREKQADDATKIAAMPRRGHLRLIVNNELDVKS